MIGSRPSAHAPAYQLLLAAAVRGEAPGWPSGWSEAQGHAFVDAALYHGVAGLIVERAAGLKSWPASILERLGGQARAQAMWELRHRAVLSQLLAELDHRRVLAIVLKGTAVAYDLYENPAHRSRGDCDLLVAPDDLNAMRSVLASLGYVPAFHSGLPDDLARQEPWTLSCGDGSSHSIDLHWQVLNTPALDGILTFAECAAHARPLPRLSRNAHALDRVRTLIHTCIHRALHRTAPYFVGSKAHYGSNRLIWSYDIHLLSASLSEREWKSFCALAAEKGIAAACLDGLQASHASFGTILPASVLSDLASPSRRTRASAYLAHGRALPRAWLELRAIPGFKSRLRYVFGRLFPGSRQLRSQYPRMAGLPLPLLYARRAAGLLRRRASKTGL